MVSRSLHSLQHDHEFPRKLRYRGILIPAFFSLKWIEEGMKGISKRPDDIWVVSYPKAGTTWTQQIVKLILNNGEQDGKILDTSVPWIETFLNSSPADIDRYPSPRTFKSHFPYDFMPCGLPNITPGRYIYVARNPKDLAVSYYYHEKRKKHRTKLEWDLFFEDFMNGEVEFGNYFNHVLSWWNHKDDRNVFFIKYEDMKKELSSAIVKIAKFIDQDIEEDVVTKIAEETTFTKMKKNPRANKSWVSRFFDPQETQFMRKGIVGDWKSLFSPEQSEKIDTLYREKLLSAGLSFDFGD